MNVSEFGPLRTLTRPIRVALYRRTPAFEADVKAEIIRLCAERPNAPWELALLKLQRANMPASRRAVWREAARRLSKGAHIRTSDATDAPADPSAPARASVQDAPSSSSVGDPDADRPDPEPDAAALDAMRAQALSGEHSVFLWSVGGPGSFVETLQTLADEGALSVELRHDDRGDPVLVYSPAHIASAPQTNA